MKQIQIPGRATRNRTRNRILILSLAFLLFLSYLLFQLVKLQFFMYEYYRDKVYDQITTTSSLIAKRGNIYDRNMNLLATSETVWRVFVSTRDIALYTEENGVDYASRIADGLSPILSLDRSALYKKLTGSKVLDVTVKKSIDEKAYKKVLAFIIENGFEKLVLTEAQTSRYYPNGTMFAHVLGFTGSDNQGLYGLEYYYDELLKGTNGYYLYAKDANGNVLPTEYAGYYPAEDGSSIVTTLDSYVQKCLESELEKIRTTHDVQNRVTGIVMDTTDGSILAMATSSPFDPNDPYTLDAESLEKLLTAGLSPDSDEYRAYKKELLEVMWSNKAVSETYEPGSTFKIVTVSTALEVGAAEITDRFSCHGFYEVGGWRIRCHKITGHGSGFTLAYGLQMSCNPTMMQIAERIGAENFYRSIESFGYFEKTGIDLPSEAETIFHKLENIGSTELATISFGQRFKVSIIKQLTAIAAVANGGMSVTPHLLERVLSSDGSVESVYESQESHRVISETVAKCVSEVLEEGVSGDGGAKNAYVDGYKVAAKTGTSQKFDVLDANGNSYLRIGSTVAYAPSDEGGIAVIIVVDEPMSTVKYGSVVAAPYVSSLLSSVLPYLEYQPNTEKKEYELPNFVGLTPNAAKKILDADGVAYEIIGNGTTILAQTPTKGDIVTKEQTTVLLYTDDAAQRTVVVPNFLGESAYTANEKLLNLGLNIRILGAQEFQSGDDVYVMAQSVAPGTEVALGTVITLTMLSVSGSE